MTTFISLFAVLFFNSVSADAIELESDVVPPRDGKIPSEIHYNEYSIASPRGKYDISIDKSTAEIVGFSFSSVGVNRIIPEPLVPNSGYPKREFDFEFAERKRQDIQIAITDVPSEYLSHRMESYLYFFPRVNLPAIRWVSEGLDPSLFEVVLPTGESVYFEKATRNTVSGVLKEGAPIDLSPDRFKRKFADFTYTGAGIMIRLDKRGADPRIGNTAVVHKVGKKPCKIPSRELFNQAESSRAEFLFDLDTDVQELIQKKCGFSF